LNNGFLTLAPEFEKKKINTVENMSKNAFDNLSKNG